MKLPTWIEAVAELRERVNAKPEQELSNARIAKKLDVAPPITHRVFDGKRNALPDMKRRINKAIGDLLADSNVTGYLDAVVALENVAKDPRSDDEFEVALKKAMTYVKLVGALLHEGYAKVMLPEIRKLPRAQCLKIFLAITLWYRKKLIRHIDGAVSRYYSVDELFDIFKAHGLNFDHLKRSASDVEELIAEEQLDFVISSALAEATNDLTLRNRLENKIEDALFKFRARQAQRRADMAKRELLGTEELVESARALGRSEARAEIFRDLADGKVSS